MSTALKTVAAYEVKALIRGAIAYGAVAALENPTFVADVRAAGAAPENRRLMVGYISGDPAYALMFKGADGAAGLAQQAIGNAGLQLYAAGKAVKLSAYSIQHQAWSKQDIPDRPGRLSAVEAEGEGALQPADDRIPALQRAASGEQPLPLQAQPLQPPYTPLVARAVQLAAIAALGEAGDDAYDRLTSLTVDGPTTTCLHIAKLNLYQCLAVAKPNYEDVFCMGQHVMMDTGRVSGEERRSRHASRGDDHAGRSGGGHDGQEVPARVRRLIASPRGFVYPAAPFSSGPLRGPAYVTPRGRSVARRISFEARPWPISF